VSFGLRIDAGVVRALAVKGQAYLTDCADRVALAGDHVEHSVCVEIS
jgi:hypothetical protein